MTGVVTVDTGDTVVDVTPSSTSVVQVVAGIVTTSAGTFSWTRVDTTANATAASGEWRRVDATSNDVTITVPTADGAPCLVTRTDSSDHVVTVALGGGGSTNVYEGGHGRMTVGNGTTADAVLDRKPYGYADYLSTNPKTANYTLVKSDAGKVVEMNSGTAKTITVPPASSVAWVTGTTLEVWQQGAGQVTIAPGAAVTVRAPSGATKIAHQYGSAGLRYRGSDEWVLTGDLTT